MDKSALKRFLKKWSFTRKFYQNIQSASQTYDIPEITPICIRRQEEYDKLRLNLFIPSVNKEHAFGGITTALELFEKLRSIMHCSARIICVDAAISNDNILPREYKIISSQFESSYEYQAVSFADRYGKSIPVHKNDIFVATAWWTAYNIKLILRQQAQMYDIVKKPFVYIIQDYEPGFYPWSTRYLLAESTYANDDDVFALINSSQLGDFLKVNNYKFECMEIFEPMFNGKIKDVLLKSDKFIKKERKILIYGRPGVHRNAFEFIIEGLKKWVDNRNDNHKWEIYSAGEKHDDIDLGKGVFIKSVGKLSLEEYANLLKETYAGISLMVSPHPSYPPLEMSVFGIKTITNTYHKKDLSISNKNIINLACNTPECLAETLEDICRSYNAHGELYVDNDFVKKENDYGKILGMVANKLLSKNLK